MLESVQISPTTLLCNMNITFVSKKNHPRNHRPQRSIINLQLNFNLKVNIQLYLYQNIPLETEVLWAQVGDNVQVVMPRHYVRGQSELKRGLSVNHPCDKHKQQKPRQAQFRATLCEHRARSKPCLRYLTLTLSWLE